MRPISEQGRIVSRSEELAVKVDAARILRTRVGQEARALLDSAMSRIWKRSEDWQKTSIRVLAIPVSGQIDPRIEPFASLPHVNGQAIESGTCRLLSSRLAKEDGVTSVNFLFNPAPILLP